MEIRPHLFLKDIVPINKGFSLPRRLGVATATALLAATLPYTALAFGQTSPDFQPGSIGLNSVLLSVEPPVAHPGDTVVVTIHGDGSTFVSDEFTGLIGCWGSLTTDGTKMVCQVPDKVDPNVNPKIVHLWRHCEGDFSNCSSIGAAPLEIPLGTPKRGKSCIYTQGEYSLLGNVLDGSEHGGTNNNCGYVPGVSSGEIVPNPQ